MSMLGGAASYRAAYLTAYAKLTDMEGADGALMGTDRFEFTFARTLLRVDVFGAAQNKITQTLKDLKGDRPKLPMKDIRAALPVEHEDQYTLVKNIYAEIRDHVRETILASIDHFAELLTATKKPSEHDAMAIWAAYSANIRPVITLINRVAPPAAVQHFISRIEKEEDDNLESEQRYWPSIEDKAHVNLVAAYRGKTENAAVDKFINDVKRAKSKRSGFKAEDRLQPLVQDAYTAAAPALIGLLDELDTLDEEIEKILRARAEAYRVDHQKFAHAFEEIYGE
jgi:hypothetical protein